MADFEITQGKTFSATYRWEDATFSYKSITGITSTLPCRVTCASHGLTTGRRVAFTGVKGMTQLNASAIPPKDKDFYEVTVIDSNTLELNAVDSTRFKTYTSGGYAMFQPPIDLAGYSARVKIKDKVGGTVLLSTEAADTPLDLITAAVSNANKTITVGITAATTEGITWKKGVFELEIEDAANRVYRLDSGAVTVAKEIVTP